ncbi:MULTISPECIES: cohesin domain-containing protein [unclassified Massilia]|uniref:cohesin domain-containing protein n=1 Tax=unclassified Massilia TaxID=2609279 RepID=UPI001B82EC37|nr:MULTISPECIES: cohesin domain-containing protein [unclassified Massilia]MBQ5938416.1 PEP-CTERM sorting domain-containing protein [Massilia sp. AB1]MBQ5963276.1 PEP-CTERM sorting domain-containing protein [Massilia sp. ZL223]
MHIFRLLSRNISCALLAAAACAAPSAGAATISVASSASQVALGQSFRVDFRIAGLSAAQYDSLGGFDLDVLFDTSVLEFAGFSFLDAAASSNQLDLPEPGSFGFFGDASAAGGTIDAYGVSGNSSAVLDGGQAGAFRFLSLDFKALAAHAGTAIQIDLADPNLLFLDSGAGLLDTNYSTARVQVAIGQTAPVPEPETLALLGLGALGLAAARRRKAGGALLAAAILAAGPATAQTSAPAPKAAPAAQASAGTPVSGEVVEVRGKRVLLRLASGESRWVSSTQELSPADVGKKLSARLAPRGDAVVMSDITFTN